MFVSCICGRRDSVLLDQWSAKVFLTGETGEQVSKRTTWHLDGISPKADERNIGFAFFFVWCIVKNPCKSWIFVLILELEKPCCQRKSSFSARRKSSVFLYIAKNLWLYIIAWEWIGFWAAKSNSKKKTEVDKSEGRKKKSKIIYLWLTISWTSAFSRKFIAFGCFSGCFDVFYFFPVHSFAAGINKSVFDWMFSI